MAPAARVDQALNRVFADQLGPGWIGGDATYSTPLPDGRESFVFSDTLIGTAEANGTATVTGVAHNSELYGWLPRLRSDYGGTTATPQPLIPDSAIGGDQWTVAATFVENGNQLTFVNEFVADGGNFDQFTGRSGLAVLTLPRQGAPALQAVVALPTDPFTQWGAALLQVGGYTYIYGEVSNTTTGQDYGIKVARVFRGDALHTTAWRYWTGTSWSAGETNAVTIATGNEFTGVEARRDHVGFEAVSIPSNVFADHTIDLSYACSPQGPWSEPTPVYAVPQVAGLVDQISYIPTFHPELSRPGADVISYNVDSLAGASSLQADIHGYQPRFVTLRSKPWADLSDLSPPVQTPESPVPLLLPLLAALLVGAAYARQHRRRRPAR